MILKHIKIFFTSRPHVQIDSYFPNVIKLSLDTNNGKDYVDSSVEKLEKRKLPIDILPIGGSFEFDVGLVENEVIVLESDPIDVRPGDEKPGAIDGVWISFFDLAGNTVLHISFRRRRNQIRFNCHRNGQGWDYSLGKRIQLSSSFGHRPPSMLSSVGCSYDASFYHIYLNEKMALSYKRHFGGAIVRLKYDYHAGSERRSIFSDELEVRRVSTIGRWLDDDGKNRRTF